MGILIWGVGVGVSAVGVVDDDAGAGEEGGIWCVC